MAASLKDIAGWFEEGRRQKAAYMIVACDTFDHDDYPVYASEENFWSKYRSVDNSNMQRIIEVYDLNKPWSQQTSGRVMNTPTRPAPTVSSESK